MGYCQPSLRDYAVWLFLWGKRALGLLSLHLHSDVGHGLNTLLSTILQIGGLHLRQESCSRAAVSSSERICWTLRLPSPMKAATSRSKWLLRSVT